MKNNNLRAEALRKNRNNDGRPKLPLTEKKGYKVTVKFATSEYYALKSKKIPHDVDLFAYQRNKDYFDNYFTTNLRKPFFLKHT